MSTNSEIELRHFFENTLKPQLRELEKIRRRKLLEGVGLALGLVGLSAVLAFHVFAAEGSAMLVFHLFILLAGIVLGYYVLVYWVKRGLVDFKPRIVDPVIRFVDPGFSYHPKAGIGQQEFLESGLFNRGIHRYRSEDRVMGTMGQTTFSFAEVHAEQRFRSGSGTRMETIFQGLYFIADLNRPFSSRTWVFPDVAERHLGSNVGNALQAIRAQFSAGDLIKLKDPEFEKSFVVYSTDPVEARHILTPALARRMLAIQSACHETPYFSFVNSNIHVAIPSYHNRFEPRIFGNLVDFELVREFHRDILMLSGFVEEMGLNTRIWSKQSSQEEDAVVAGPMRSSGRVLCGDETCTGIVGANGMCGVCGRRGHQRRSL